LKNTIFLTQRRGAEAVLSDFNEFPFWFKSWV